VDISDLPLTTTTMLTFVFVVCRRDNPVSRVDHLQTARAYPPALCSRGQTSEVGSAI
jgi:hypothetical protein